MSAYTLKNRRRVISGPPRAVLGPKFKFEGCLTRHIENIYQSSTSQLIIFSVIPGLIDLVQFDRCQSKMNCPTTHPPLPKTWRMATKALRYRP